MRICAELMEAKLALRKSLVETSYSCQFVEIYDERVMDLFTGQEVKIRRDTGDLVGATESSFSNLEDVFKLLKAGHANKKFAATAMNDRSSRSHTALIIHVTRAINCSHEGNNSNNKSMLVKTQLHLVDLAGSERLKKSKVNGENLKEAVQINSSLLSLGKVITALGSGHHHVPYLESKLTLMLKRAFGGNSRTISLIHCRSEDEFGDESLQSLRFGERCGLITNKIRSAAASIETALASIDEALKSTSAQLAILEKNGKTNLKQYASLKAAYIGLSKRRLILTGDTVNDQSV